MGEKGAGGESKLEELKKLVSASKRVWMLENKGAGKWI